MSTEKKGRRWRRVWIGILALILLGLAFDRLMPADVRPASLEDNERDEPAARERLERVRAAHGAEAWEQYRVMDVVFYDDWPFWLTRAPLTPWDVPRQKLRAKLLRRNWTTEFELLNGDRPGERWGLQSWKTWRAEPGGDPVFEDSWVVATTLAGLRYFIELPLPQDTATHVQDAGMATWNGKTYERLYVTWERGEPQRDFDQYVLWIDPQSGLVARVDFTIRALSGLAVARAAFEEYADAGGVRFPRKIVIDGVLPTGHTLPVHTIEIERVEWDTVEPDALKPDPTLADMGEAKPS